MKRKPMREFVKENRAELDACIKAALNDPDYRLNDSERCDWVMNDEGLYRWAKSEGVRV